MGISNFMYNTFMKTNLRFGLFVVTGGFVFSEVFNKITSHVFRNGLNEGRGWPYYEKDLLLRQANAANEDDDDE